MKLAFSTSACAGWELSRIVEAAQRLGFSGIELAGFDDVGDHTAGLLHSAEAMQHLLTPVGLQICSLATTVSLHYREAARWQRAREGLHHALGLARECGASVVRVFAMGMAAGESRHAMTTRVAGRLKEIGEILGGFPRQMSVAVQNAGALARARELWNLLELVGPSKHVGACWDAAEGNGAPGASAWSESPALAVPTLNSRIRLAHVWDHDGAGMPVEMGSGRVPVRSFIERLRGIGYTGWVVYAPPATLGERSAEWLQRAAEMLVPLVPPRPK